MARLKRWIAVLAATAMVATGLLATASTAQAAPGDPAGVGKVLKPGKPTVSGTLAVGSTLKAKPGKWTAKTKLSYQWLRDGERIGKATKTSYKLTAADAGAQLSVVVTGKRPGYQTVAVTSPATARVAKPVTPRIQGQVAVGVTLTAVPGNWPAGTQFSYQWLRSNKKIKGATAVTYQVGRSDIGKQLSVTVTGKQAGWATASRTSGKTSKVLKAGTPAISGTVAVGSTVKVKAGSWTSKTKLSYQWLRDGATIGKATKSSYKITTADAGRHLTVKVTGKRKGYVTTSRTSAPRTVSTAVLKASTPTVTGTVKAGSTLTANPGSWTTGVAFTYQWYADAQPLTNATSSTFKVTYLDVGKKLSVQVTGSKAGFGTVSRMSAATAMVPPVPNHLGDQDGMRLVGVDVLPGTYLAAGSYRCAWERRTNSGNDDAGIIASGPYHDRQVLVTLRAGEYFYAEGCGPWSPAPTQLGSAVSGFDDGDHLVRVQVLPGIYASNGGPNCVLWRLEDAGLDLDLDVGEGGILGIGPIHSGHAMMEVAETDKVVTSAGCGWWGMWEPDRTMWLDEIGDGDYAVLTPQRRGHLVPGIWRTTTATDACYVEAGSGFAGTYDEITAVFRPDEGQTTIEMVIESTDVRFTTMDCGTWTRIGDYEPEQDTPEPMTASPSPREVGSLSPAEAKARQAEPVD